MTKYILIPLPVIQEIFRKPQTGIGEILCVGIYRVAQALKTNEYNAIRQLFYCHYRGGLTDSLKSHLERLEQEGVFCSDNDYNGFNYQEFIPNDEVESISEYCKNHPSLKEEIEEFHRLRQVSKVLGINFDISSLARTYKAYFEAYGGFCNQPLVSISSKMMLDFYKNKKTDYEKALLAMYAGIRSIIGTKAFACTTSSMIKCRMFGAKDGDTLETMLNDDALKSAHGKYTTDYHYKKMLKELVARGFLKSEIGYNKRTYLSCKLDMKGLEDAIVSMKEKSVNAKVRQVTANRLKARESINKRLGNNPQNHP